MQNTDGGFTGFEKGESTKSVLKTIDRVGTLMLLRLHLTKITSGTLESTISQAGRCAMIISF